MNTHSLNPNRSAPAFAAAILAFALVAGPGCTVRHVPKVRSIAATGMSNLRGSQPIDVRAGESSVTETNFGTVGMGTVKGKPSEWTDVAVRMVRTNLAARGATLTPGASKALTITMTKAEVKGIPFVGGATTRIALSATGSDGLNRTIEASNSSMAPLASVDGAVEDAVKKLLADSAVDAYLRK